MNFIIERNVLEELLNNTNENDETIEVKVTNDSIVASVGEKEIEQLCFVKLKEPVDGSHYGYIVTYLENSDTEKTSETISNIANDKLAYLEKIIREKNIATSDEINELLETLTSIRVGITKIQLELLDLLVKTCEQTIK